MNEFNDFLAWEGASRDTIDFKKIYVDVAGDLHAGLMLSEIVYWYLPGKHGSKLRIEREGRDWIAVKRYEWWERTRMSPKEADHALSVLLKRGIIVKEIFKFGSDPTVHVSLNTGTFLKLWNENVAHPLENPYSPKVNNEIDESGRSESTKGEKPYTESTTESTTETLDQSAKSPRPRNPMFDAVSWAWNNNNGSYVGKLIKFLTGACVPKDGKYYDWQISPPMNAREVVAYKIWRDYEERDVMPSSPETMNRTIEEFRGVPEYDRILENADRVLITLGQPTAPALAPPAAQESPPEPIVIRSTDAVFDALDQKLGGQIHA